MNALLLMMGGTGSRFGASRPKQYTLIDDIPLFAYIVRKIDTLQDLDRLVIVSHEDWLEYVKDWCNIFMHNIPYDIVHGGSCRSESVLFGLDKLSEYADDQDVVMIHDATHPYIDEAGMKEIVAAVKEYGGATLVSKNYDTVYEQDENGFLKQVLQRDNVVAGASPEAFRFGDIYHIYKDATFEELNAMTSAGAIALAHQIPMKVVPAQYLNLKITYQRDMELFLKLYDTYFFNAAEQIAREKMEVLKAFDRLCKDSHLEYFMYGRLLVGSVHYEDMILGTEEEPWRLGMRRDEYEKLLNLLPEKAESYGIVHNKDSLGVLSSTLSISKVIALPETDRKLIYEIYVMPFDDVPEEADARKFYIRKAKWKNKFLNKIYLAKDDPEELMGETEKKIYQRFATPKRYERLVQAAKKYHGDPNSVEVGCVVGYRSRFITKDELYPLVDRKFGSLMIPSPKHYEPWTTVMTPEVEERIHKIQKVDLLLLKEFDRVCRKIGVGYFLCGGSMLGYMRHDGFIPWDDDIDIGMLRRDYDIFLREAGKYLDKDLFFLQTRQSDPQIPYLFSKIRVNHTEYITIYNENRHFHKGICLDLFPFDVLPEDERECDAFVEEVRKAVKQHNFIVNRQVAEPVYEHGPRTFSDGLKRVRGKINRSIYKSLSLKKTQQKYLDVVTRYNNRELTPETTVASFVPTYTYVKIKHLLPYKDIMFEGVPAMLMNKPDVFLTMQYGDYMKYPPAHKQMGHGLIRWSADVPENKDKNSD